MKTIDFAIDLGTTNSLIARQEGGSIKVFKNPRGFKETLPSVVAYRKNGVLVGEKARELKDRDHKNVFSSFKRKIGTDSSYFISSEDTFKTAIDFSALVLKELKSFAISERFSSVVITVPASFNTIQSNATKEAGIQAGFEEIVLLQEPIAASLAVFNNDAHANSEGNWLVYDLGGGTFDAAIVKASSEELKVLDHEGNNFLGGLDFDYAILNHVIIPALENYSELSETVAGLKARDGIEKYEQLNEFLLVYAEQLKVELSSFNKSFIDFTINDDNGNECFVEVQLTVEKFNELITPFIQSTINMVKDLLSKNAMTASSIREIVLVGGSTYIPFIRTLVEKELGITVNQKVDPTTAIVIGAAYYAGNKETHFVESSKETLASTNLPKIDLVYEKNARGESEMVILKTDAEIGKYSIRLIRKDRGYDSGLIDLQPTQRFMLPLVQKTVNEFSIELFDDSAAKLEEFQSTIIIHQGSYSIDGQPLPHDVCIEVDDLEGKETLLEVIFKKNDILPLTKTIYKTVSRDLLKSSDEVLQINILEGDKDASPASNEIIGQVVIDPKKLGQNLFKGTDIGITLTINESRDLSVVLNVLTIDYNVSEAFAPNHRTVNSERLKYDVNRMLLEVSHELKASLNEEDFENAATYRNLELELQNLSKLLEPVKIGSDILYNADEQKRILAIRYDKLIRSKKISNDVDNLRYTIFYVEELLEETDLSVDLKSKMERSLESARKAVVSGNLKMIRSSVKKLDEVSWEYRRRSVDHLKGIYVSFTLYPDHYFKNEKEAHELFKKGQELLARPTITSNELMVLINRIASCLKPEYLKRDDAAGNGFKGTGLE